MQGYTPATSGLNYFSASFNKSKQSYLLTANQDSLNRRFGRRLIHAEQ
jgi:hypothetical protein